MASHIIIRVRHTACRKEFEEEKLENHIRIDHGFDTRLESEYLASLERRIKELEDSR